MADSVKKHPNAGRKQSPEHIAKRVAAYIGKPLSEKHKKRLASIERTPEWREKIRQARLRQANVADAKMTARKWWAELKANPIKFEAYRAKLRAAKVNGSWNKGRPWSDEVKKKLSAFFKGRPNYALIGRKYTENHRKSLSVSHMGIEQTEESKQKRSLTLKGRATVPPDRRPRGTKHHNWGKPAYRGSGWGHGSYCQKGHWVRSTWERGIADWLYAMGVEYQYEPKIFDLGDDVRYRPDFYIPQADLFLEVKGYMWEADEEKLRRFVALGHRLFIIGKTEWKLFEEDGSVQIPGLGSAAL